MNLKLYSLFLIISLVFSDIIIAQTVITANGINYKIGETYTFEQMNDSVNPGDSGTNQIWDLSTISNTTTNNISIVDPATTSHGSNFPNANVAIKSLLGGENFFKTSSTTLQFYGLEANGVLLPYSNPEDIMRFPFTYNDSYTDTFELQFTSGGYDFIRTGTTSVTADAYGTLITPNGTYNNVLRVHKVQNFQDSAINTAPFVNNYTSEEYVWFKEGINMHIASTFKLETSFSPPNYSTVYLTGNVGFNTETETIKFDRIYPNPAISNITVEVNFNNTKKANLKIYNSLGQEVISNKITHIIPGINKIELNIENLPSGIYFAQILQGDVASTKRFVLEK